MKTMKSRLRRPDGTFAEITAKVSEKPKKTQAEKDTEVAAQFEANLKKQEPKQAGDK